MSRRIILNLLFFFNKKIVIDITVFASLSRQPFNTPVLPAGRQDEKSARTVARLLFGADGRSRTVMRLPPQVFETCVSTNSTTSAGQNYKRGISTITQSG